MDLFIFLCYYIFKSINRVMETLIKFKKTKIILADGGAFVGDHANVKLSPIRATSA